MADTVGEITYVVKVDTKGMITGIKQANDNMEKMEKDGNGSMDKLKGGVKSLATAVGATLVTATVSATTALIGLGKKAVQSFAEQQQLVGGIETLFGTGGRTIEEYAKKQGKAVDQVADEYRKLVDTQDAMLTRADAAFMTAGLSANDYMETVTSFSASLIASLGGDTAKAANYADQAIIDMSDNANKMGSSMESIQNAYQGFAKQNYTMLDNLKLGYGGTKTEMERLLKDAEKISGMKFSIDSFADVTQAIHVIQENMDIAGTTAREAESTISGSLNMVKASWENLLVGVADDTQNFPDLINNFVTSLKTAMKNILPTIKVSLKGVVELIKELIPIIKEELPSLIKELLPPIIEATVMIFEALVEALPDIIDMLIESAPVFVDAIVKIVEVIIANLPRILWALAMAVATALAVLVQSVFDLLGDSDKWIQENVIDPISENWKAFCDWVGKVFNGFVDGLKMGLELVGKFFSDVVNGFVEGWNKGLQMILGFFEKAKNTIINIWTNIKNGITNIAVTIGNAVGGAIKGAINTVLGFVENVVNAPIKAINGLIDVINAVPGISLGKLSTLKLPRLATGGIVESRTGGSVIMAGEAGEDEWVVPESKMASLISQMNERGAGGNITINVEGIWATSESQKREVAMDIWSKIQEVNKMRMGQML